MVAKEEVHVHKYEKLAYVREFGTNIARANKMVPNPEPKDINRIILIRNCTCGASQAFECGDPDDMRALYRLLNIKR